MNKYLAIDEALAKGTDMKYGTLKPSGSLNLVIQPIDQTLFDPSGNFEAYKKKISEITDGLNFRHLGFLRYWEGMRGNFYPCGGTIAIGEIPNALLLNDPNDRFFSEIQRDKNFRMYLWCSGCQTLVGLAVAPDELPHLMYHLMLKQLAPEIPSLRFVDTERLKGVRGDSIEEEAKALGIISLAPNILYGPADPGWRFPRPNSSEGIFLWNNRKQSLDLGFTLGAGICPPSGIEGKLLRLLVYEKFQQLKQEADRHQGRLLGSKRWVAM